MAARLAQKYRHIRHLAQRLYSLRPSYARRLYSAFAPLREHFYADYWRQVADTLSLELEDWGHGYFRLQSDTRSTWVRAGEVQLDDHLTLELAGDKPLMHRLLQQEGVPVPEFLEFDLHELSAAEAFLQQIDTPCVIKPAAGAAGGAGITTRITSRQRLRRAAWVAAGCSPGGRLLIEAQHEGDSYRLLYLHGEFIDAIRRQSPGVTGDGRSSLRQLIQQENRSRLDSGGRRALSPLTLDLDARHTLRDSGKRLGEVLPKGQRLAVKTASNQYQADENHSVRNQLHPGIIRLGQRVSRQLDITLCGVDMMIGDATVPPDESDCVVNEVNTTPALHHHLLISEPEKVVDVGVRIMEAIFSGSTQHDFMPAETRVAGQGGI